MSQDHRSPLSRPSYEDPQDHGAARGSTPRPATPAVPPPARWLREGAHPFGAAGGPEQGYGGPDRDAHDRRGYPAAPGGPGHPGAPGSRYGGQEPGGYAAAEPPGYGAPEPGYGARPAAGYPGQEAGGYGAPPAAGYPGQETGGYGAPPAAAYPAQETGRYAPPQSAGYAPPGTGDYTGPQPGGYAAPQPGGYAGQTPGGYAGQQPGGYAAQQPGGYAGQQGAGYGAPEPGYGAPEAAGYGAQEPAGYAAPTDRSRYGGPPPGASRGVAAGAGYAAPPASFGGPEASGYATREAPRHRMTDPGSGLPADPSGDPGRPAVGPWPGTSTDPGGRGEFGAPAAPAGTEPAADGYSSAAVQNQIRQALVHRVQYANALHASHYWDLRRTKPVGPHALVFLYTCLDPAFSTSRRPYYEIKTASRLFRDGEDVQDLPTLLQELTEIAKGYLADGGVFDPVAQMTQSAEPMPADASYVGVAVSTLLDGDRTSEDSVGSIGGMGIPGRCLVALADGNLLVLDRPSRSHEQVEVYATFPHFTSGGVEYRSWRAFTAEQQADPSWVWLRHLNQLAMVGQERKAAVTSASVAGGRRRR